MKLWWSLLIVAVVLPFLASAAKVNTKIDLWEDDDKEVLVRMARATKDRASGAGNTPNCRYGKSQWTECDSRTNMRTRTLTLKKGDKNCEQIKTISKKCKKDKPCRYEKGTWSSCIDQIITRIDNIKPNSDPSCDKTRRMTKKCKSDGNNKKAQKDRSEKKSNKKP